MTLCWQCIGPAGAQLIIEVQIDMRVAHLLASSEVSGFVPVTKTTPPYGAEAYRIYEGL
jgi:hypothetical protein